MRKTIYSREYKAFLKLLRTTRKELGLSQKDLASRLGQTQTFVSKCERGERRLDVIELRHFLKAMDVPFSIFTKRLDSGQ
jgi:transcriptional regulator with XRE-family HTH domain